MKKLITLILAIGFVLLLASCNANTLNTTPDEDGVIQTPVRVGRGVIQSSLRAITFEEAIDEADLIADVTITSWLSENTDNRSTFFNAKINHTLKGDVFEEIVIRQSGSSEITHDNFPLFKVGDRLLLFLSNIDRDYEWVSGLDPELDLGIELGLDTELDLDKNWALEWLSSYYPYENTHGILSSHITVLHVEEKDDNSYLISRFNWPSYSSLGQPPRIHSDMPYRYNITSSDIVISDDETAGTIIAQRDSFDPLLARTREERDSVFFYDEIAQLIGEVASI